MILPSYHARDLLAANVERLMQEHPDKASPAKLARYCIWPAGTKRGKRVSERQIRYVLDTRADAVPPSPSPTLDLIVAIGNAFDVPAWQLLVDDKQLRQWTIGKLFARGDTVPLDEEVRRLYELPGPSTALVAAESRARPPKVAVMRRRKPKAKR